MALFAIGDVQGCRHNLTQLLARICFNEHADRLWFIGDLVNRGPDSLGTLRLVRDLNAQLVLGNHDLHLLAVAAGARPVKRNDTFMDVLKAHDRDDLLAWLARQPLFVRDDKALWAMVHAGLPPGWSVETASHLAREVERELAAHYHDRHFLQQIYGDQPGRWCDVVDDMDRVRFIVNAMTRMRFCDSEGELALNYSGPPGSQPPPFRPWFELWPHGSHRIVFGHWSMLGAGNYGNAISLDSGCVWGHRLTAVRLKPEPLEFFSIACRHH
ncbi:MAG: Bis(5'-nucleosyl)-tetraphosphatase, symmetrical [Gammaproteobacteria bacterium]|nr:Bis(5'-nucleosyl)-tetraphosphatase, symmetrical [Gammaproteobacteria bacterium]